MKRRYRKIGKTYVAIHYDETKVFLVEDTYRELEVKIWHGKKAVEQLDKHNGVDISAAEFVSKFSIAISKLHSQTPYA